MFHVSRFTFHLQQTFALFSHHLSENLNKTQLDSGWFIENGKFRSTQNDEYVIDSVICVRVFMDTHESTKQNCKNVLE